METIIAATDFSSAANNAVEYSIQLAMKFNTRLVLVYACPVPPVSYEVTSYAEVISRTVENADRKLESLREDIFKTYKPDVDIECEAEIGSPYEVIDGAAKKYGAGLIVTGITREAGTLKEYFIGSTSIKVARNQGTPTFIIPDGVKYKPVKRIGFACDMKTEEEKETIFVAKYFSQIFGAELDIITVENPTIDITLERLHTNLFIENKLMNVKHKSVELSGTDVVLELENYFDSDPTDIIMLNPKKHNALYYIFNESVTKELAFHAGQPILAIH